MKACRFLVSGRVQGVSFRASTQARGRALGLTGWVRNLPDGRVEIQAGGDPEAMLAFEHWLGQGPELARVTALEVDDLAPQAWQGFDIR